MSVFWRGAWLEPPELEARRLRLAAHLLGLGVAAGDRVGVLCYNHLVHLDSLYAALEFGFVHTPFNYRLPPLELAGLVQYIEPKVLLYSAEFAKHAQQAQNAIPELILIDIEALEDAPLRASRAGTNPKTPTF